MEAYNEALGALIKGITLMADNADNLDKKAKVKEETLNQLVDSVVKLCEKVEPEAAKDIKTELVKAMNQKE